MLIGLVAATAYILALVALGRAVALYEIFVYYLPSGLCLAFGWRSFEHLWLPLAIYQGAARIIGTFFGIMMLDQLMAVLFHWPLFAPEISIAFMFSALVIAIVLSVLRFFI